MRARAQLRAAYADVLVQLGELCAAAQAVLDGKARQISFAGDQFIIVDERALQRLEAVLTKIRRGA